MTRRADPKRSVAADKLTGLLRLWTLRLLVPQGGSREFVGRDAFSHRGLANALDLEARAAPGGQPFAWEKALAAIVRLYQQAERGAHRAVVPTSVRKNVERLADFVGLQENDRRICEFVGLLHSETSLGDAANLLGNLNAERVVDVVAATVRLSRPDVDRALAANGLLSSSGILAVDRTKTAPLRDKLRPLVDGFAEWVTGGGGEPIALLRGVVSPSPSPALGVADFDHLGQATAVLRACLRDALSTKRKGVNLFIYGEPGAGKTQLARVVAAELGAELFEVASEDPVSGPMDADVRLRALQTSQRFLARRRAAILFDDAEEVFARETERASFRRFLEDNPIPVLWISAPSWWGDAPAALRRFDVVVHVPLPPAHWREKIVRRTCSGFLSDAAATRLAAADGLAPAVVARSAFVASVVRDEFDAAHASTAFEFLVNGALKVQGRASVRHAGAGRLPDHYSPSFVNATADLQRVADGIASTRSARLCLYGPPGTGKTAYGRWLANRLQAPLHLKRASDLLSMWVGENEKNIATAFEEAEREGALLLIDEVDSFLQDRRKAVRSWEVTAVNEMMTQMESFQGVFIASTNLVEDLDQAALRRFDLKVKFDYLKPDQAWGLFVAHCEALGFPGPSEEAQVSLSTLSALTPGDFAAVARRHRFEPLRDPADLLGAIESECALKEGAAARTVSGFRV